MEGWSPSAGVLELDAIQRLRLTFQRYTAGVGSALPAPSVAKTLNRCLPRLTFSAKVPPSQAWAGLLSSLQVKVEGARLDPKRNFAFTRFLVVLTVFLGCPVIVVSGGDVLSKVAVTDLSADMST
jgi:hypothetical protein